jgi:TPR repeat protein
MLTLGLGFSNGNGVPKNFEEARGWLEKSAAAGNQSQLTTIAQDARWIDRAISKSIAVYRKQSRPRLIRHKMPLNTTCETKKLRIASV